MDAINENVYPELAILSDNIGTIDSAVALPKGSTELKALINEFIKAIKESGTFDDMQQRWFVDGDYTMPDLASPEKPTKTYTFATFGELKPYNYIGDNGKLMGFDIEFIKRFEIFANVKVNIEVMSFSAMVASLQSHRIDAAVSNFNITPERQEVIDFSDPYFSEPQAIVVKKSRLEGYSVSNKQITEYSELEDKTIAILTGTIFPPIILERNPNQKIAYYDAYSDIIHAVKNGKADAYVCEELNAIFAQRRNPNTFVILNEDLGNSDTAFVTKKGNDDLLRLINPIIEKYREDGTLDELAEKWFYSANSIDAVVEMEDYDAPNTRK